MPQISVIIPAYTKENLTKDCLASFAASVGQGADFDIIVVDNAAALERTGEEQNAGPELAAFGKSLFGQSFHYIPIPENRNFAGACNAGAKASKAEFLFFLNNDTRVEKNWWQLATYLAEDKTLGAIGPLLLFPPDEAGTRHIQHAGIAFDPAFNPCHIYEGFVESHPVAAKARPLQAITGAALMLRRSLFESLGGFDEAYRNGYEDLDLCAKLQALGLKVAIAPEVRVEHWCGQSPGRNTCAAENRALFLQKAAAFKPDLHTLLAQDGYTLSLTPWGTWQSGLTVEHAQVVSNTLNLPLLQTQLEQEPYLALLQTQLEQEPFWLAGHLAFLDFCLASGKFNTLFAHASRYYPFDSTPQTMLRIVQAAYACGFAVGENWPPISSSLYETAKQAAQYAEKILHLHILPFEERTLRMQHAVGKAKNLGIPCAFDNLEEWREKEYRPFLQQLGQLAFFRMPPLSGLPYTVWQETVEPDLPLKGNLPARKADAPFFSILMPVYNPEPAYFEAALASCLAQTYAYFELCVVDDASTNPEIAACIHRFMQQDARIKAVFCKKNGHICAASQSGLEICTAPWVVLVDHDDVLPAHALEQVALTIAKCKAEGKTPCVLFSDEDRLDEKTGTRTSPFFKMGFDPVLLLACNCVSHLGVFRADILREFGFRRGYEGSQDHDLALRILHAYGAEAFVHIPQILYHWRQHGGSTASHIEAKPYVKQASQKARADFLCGYGANSQQRGEMRARAGSNFADVYYTTPSPAPLLSCIIPFCPLDFPSPAAFMHALERLLAQTGYEKKEVLLAPYTVPALTRHEDSIKKAQAFCQSLRFAEKNIRLLPLQPIDFAYAPAFLNSVAAEAKGKVLAFLGMAEYAPAFAQTLVAALWQENVGIAGGRAVALQPETVPSAQTNTGHQQNGQFLLHAGYALGGSPKGLAICPAYAGLHIHSAGYYSFAHLTHTVMAVGFPSFFCRAALFKELGGFAENFVSKLPSEGFLTLTLVDFCLRARGQGFATLLHTGADVFLPSFFPLSFTPCSVPAYFLASHPILSQSLCQNPLLTWAAGGWKFAFPAP